MFLAGTFSGAKSLAPWATHSAVARQPSIAIETRDEMHHPQIRDKPATSIFLFVTQCMCVHAGNHVSVPDHGLGARFVLTMAGCPSTHEY